MKRLHLIVEIPIFLHDEKRMMKVEVQFRTISMDFWASLEHKIRYKKELPVIEEVEKELYECAIVSAELENRMERIQKLADQYRAYEKWPTSRAVAHGNDRPAPHSCGIRRTPYGSVKP